jgi:hypothetical protein
MLRCARHPSNMNSLHLFRFKQTPIAATALSHWILIYEEPDQDVW